MATAPQPVLPTAHAIPVAPNPPLAPRSKVKKKVRMREVIIDDQPSKPIDSFRVTISDVRATLRVAEARPVVLSFAFDNYWHAETDVFREQSVEPVWKFNADSFRGVDGTKLSEPKSQGPVFRPTPRGIVPEASFTYETEFGYKLHRKFLVVKLSERSPYQDVEWGTGVLPLDSIARGCRAVNLSIIAKNGVTCYGTVYFNVTMTNVQRVRAHITDLKLSEYPEAYNYDVKLIYLEFGHNGFEKGFSKCTEKRSDAEPRFSAQPALEWDTTLDNMLTQSTPNAPALKIFFSVHRQVARNRTEQIGVGALPIRMLFPKVKEGWMDLPTKFKVPLANYKGVIRGKLLLRNIPQFSQLPGDDIVNVDGTIMPQEVDLDRRKILPWIKLPKSREVISPPPHAGTAIAMPKKKDQSLVGTVANSLENYSEPAVGDSRRADVIAKMHINGGSGQNFHSPVTESASDGGSESSRATSPARKQTSVLASPTLHVQETRRHVAQNTPSNQVPAASPQNDASDAEHASSVSKICSRFESATVSHVDQIRMIGALRNAAQEAEEPQKWREEPVTDQVGTYPQSERQRERSDEGSRTSRRRSSAVSDDLPDAHDSYWSRGRRSKSGKSIGSAGTGGTTDGGVEIGSVVLSEDGYGTGSRTTTEDALMAVQRLNSEPPLDDGTDDMGDADSTLAAAPCSMARIGEEDEDEWVAFPDPSSQRYYFVSQYTQESLWLPPDWERMEDEDGRQYFVDHGSRSTQRAFPAREARAYRESVYAE